MSCGCGNKSNTVKTVNYKGGDDSCGTGLHWKNILGIPDCIIDCDALLNFITNNFTGELVEETDPTVPSWVKAITETNISNWNTAFSWGNHAGLYVPLSRSIIAGNGLTGGGALTSNVTISHGNTSSVENASLSGPQTISSVIFDEFGHVTAISLRDLTPEDIGAMPEGTIPDTPTLQDVTEQGASTSILSTFLGGLSVSNTITIPAAGSIVKSGTGLRISSGDQLEFFTSSEDISFYRNSLLTNVIYPDGRMAGANAINSNEFVTKGQLDAIILEPGSNIINQFDNVQLDSNFWIDGDGRIEGNLYIGNSDLYHFGETDVILGSYPNSRDDSAESPENILYTNSTGTLLSAPVSSLPFILETRQVLAGSGLSGGGNLSSDVTLQHGDTSSQANVTFNLSSGEVLSSIEFDTFGHVTSVAKGNLTASSVGAVPTTRTLLISAGSGISTSPSTSQSLASNRTWEISHADTSTLNGQLITVGEVLESITVDGFGHVTAFTTAPAGEATPNLQQVTDVGFITSDQIEVRYLIADSSIYPRQAFGSNIVNTPSIFYNSDDVRWQITTTGQNPAKMSGAPAEELDEFITLSQLNAATSEIETGTWSPQLRGYRGPSTGDPSPSMHTVSGYTVDTAFYYKFGAMVYLLVNISWTASGITVEDAGSLLEIVNLPFPITTAGTGSYVANRGALKHNALMDSFFEALLVQHSLPAYGQVAELWNSDGTYIDCGYLSGVGAGTWQISIMINYMSGDTV